MMQIISLVAIVFVFGYLVGYNQREIMELLTKISALINVKSNSSIVRGREVVTTEEPEKIESGIVKPIDPKEVARRSANKFNKDFDL